MNKKILAILMILALQTPVFAGSYIDKQLKEAKKNEKYKTTQKHISAPVQQFQYATVQNIKDPKLIELSDIKPVDNAAYKTKIASDEKIYTTKIYNVMFKKDLNTVNVQPYALDFYNLYRISERIIRANNLEYVNWRISVRKSDDWNAYSTGINSINIYTGLYDSLYGNDDALAFIIGHEMAHILLGHQQRKQEILDKWSRSERMRQAMPYGSIGRSTGGLSTMIQEKRFNAEARKMEYLADTLGAELMTRAGFDMNKGIQAINQLEAMAHVDTFLSRINADHPMPEEREASMRENLATFPSEWVNDGKQNIMDSNVLEVKKSTDRVSIVISGTQNPKKVFELEPIDKKLLRIAYMNYKNGQMVNAVKYFKKLNDIRPSYVNYLYMSYANEYLYNQTRDEKYLKQSTADLTEAKKLNPDLATSL